MNHRTSTIELLSDIPRTDTPALLDSPSTSVDPTSPAGEKSGPSATTTSTPSPTSSLVLTTTWAQSLGPEPTMGSYNCPSDDRKTYRPTTNENHRWTMLCDRDYPSDSEASGGGTVRDIQAVLATSLESCIDQCELWNNEQAQNGIVYDPDKTCKAVSYGANIQLALSRSGIYGNCFLKTQTSAKPYDDFSGQQEVAYIVEGL
jgi:hypothetical protein